MPKQTNPQTATPEKISDAISLIFDRDERGLEFIVGRCVPIIRGPLRAKFPGLREDQIENAITDALLVIWNDPGCFDQSRSIDAFLYLIAFRKAVDLVRKEGRRKSKFKNLDVENFGCTLSLDSADRHESRAQLEKHLQQLISRLSPLERCVVRADYRSLNQVDGKTSNIPRIIRMYRWLTGKSTNPGSIYQARRTAKEKLRNGLEDLGYQPIIRSKS